VALSVGVSRLVLIFQATFLGSFATFIFINFSRDNENYKNLYERVSEVDLSWFSALEPIPLMLFYFSNSLNIHYVLFVGTLISFAMFVKLWIFKNFSRNYLISLLFYLSWFFLLHDATQLRISLATPLLLFSIYFIASKQYWRANFLGLIGLTFHYSFVFYFIFFVFDYLISRYEIHRQKILLLICMVLAIAIFNFGGISSFLINLGEGFIPFKILGYFERGGTIGLSLKHVFVIMILLLLMPLYNGMNDFERVALRSVVFGGISNFIFCDLPILAVRVSELFYLPFVFLIPLLVEKYKPIGFSYLMYFLVCFFFLSYFMFIGLFVFDE
jgi:hypothetical protein